jgi:hypothetical protein
MSAFWMSLPKAASGEKPYGRSPWLFIGLNPRRIEKPDSSRMSRCKGPAGTGNGAVRVLISAKGQACFDRVAERKIILGKERTQTGKGFIDHGFARTEERQRRIIAFTP